MDSAKTIKELRSRMKMNRKEFSEYTGIPVRTLEDWEASRRTPPEYVLRLLYYQIRYEENIYPQKINIITDPDNSKIVLINDVRFKSRRKINWNEIEDILKEYIGKYYEIFDTSEVIYIGSDFPDEYSHSVDTKNLKGANKKAKANAITVIGQLIQNAENKTEYPDFFGKHANRAKYGWYRYSTKFGIPVYNENEELERYNIFGARMLVRRDRDGKLYLYDITRIKKETSRPPE